MKKYKLKKGPLIALICIILIPIIIFIIIKALNKEKSYNIEYSYKEYNILEQYNKDTKEYYFEITKDKKIYSFISREEYTKKRKLISKIYDTEDEDYTCITIKSDYVKSNPLCTKGDESIDYRLTSTKLLEEFEITLEENKEYQELNKYKVYQRDNIYIWNFKGLYNLEQKQDIKIFSKDIYDTKLISHINNLILIPDYEQELTFDKIYIFNMDNNEIDEWELEYEISFDSNILGAYDKSIYIIDKNKKIEYELVPHKKKMRIVGTESKKGIIYENNEITTPSISNIINNNLHFKYQFSYNYSLINNYIYLNYYNSNNKIKISNLEVDKLIMSKEDNVYYLKEDKLYRYNIKNGQELILQYENWTYNSNNMIFINNQNPS